jgi:hypothetical protein
VVLRVVNQLFFALADLTLERGDSLLKEVAGRVARLRFSFKILQHESVRNHVVDLFSVLRILMPETNLNQPRVVQGFDGQLGLEHCDIRLVMICFADIIGERS